MHDVSRFSRGSADYFQIKSQLHSYGVRLRSATQSVDDSPVGIMSECIWIGVFHVDNKRNSNRALDEILERLSRGDWMWLANLGYWTARDDFGASLDIDPSVGPLILKAFELFDAAFRQRHVLNRMSTLGLRTARGKCLTPQTFRDLLSNPVYAGWI